MACRVIFGEGWGVRPTAAWLPGGPGLSVLTREVRGKEAERWGSSAMGEVFTEHLLLGYLQK